jgi:hypothetical protein
MTISLLGPNLANARFGLSAASLLLLLAAPMASADSPNVDRKRSPYDSRNLLPANFILQSHDVLSSGDFRKRFVTFNLTNARHAGFSAREFNTIVSSGVRVSCEKYGDQSHYRGGGGWFIGSKSCLVANAHVVIDEKDRILLHEKAKKGSSTCFFTTFSELSSTPPVSAHHPINPLETAYSLGLRSSVKTSIADDRAVFQPVKLPNGMKYLEPDLDHPDLAEGAQLFMITIKPPKDFGIEAAGPLIMEKITVKTMLRLEQGLSVMFTDGDNFPGTSGSILVRHNAQGKLVATGLHVAGRGPNPGEPPKEWSMENTTAAIVTDGSFFAAPISLEAFPDGCGLTQSVPDPAETSDTQSPGSK